MDGTSTADVSWLGMGGIFAHRDGGDGGVNPGRFPGEPRVRRGDAGALRASRGCGGCAAGARRVI